MPILDPRAELTDYDHLAGMLSANVARKNADWSASFDSDARGPGRTILESFLRRQADALVDPDLSPEGRQNRVRSLAAEARKAAAEFMAAKAGVLDQRRTEKLAGILAQAQPARPHDAAEALRLEFRLQAIRTELRTLPRESRAMLLEAPDTDPEVALALMTAHPVVERVGGGVAVLRPFIDPAVLDRARLARARRLSPLAAAEVDGLETLAGAYKQLGAFIENSIGRVVPLGPSEALPAAR